MQNALRLILKPVPGAALVLLGSTAQAQTPPDAGSLLQQQQQQQQQQQAPRKPGPEPAPLRPPPDSLNLPAGTQVRVERFELRGNTLIDSEALLAELKTYQGRSLSLAELRAAAATVGAAYERAGWLARVALPPQDVTEGVIRLKVVEARFGAVQVTQDAERFSSQRAAERLQAQPGQPLSLPALDRALLLLDDLPGLSASGSLAAGAQEGLTDVQLKLGDTPLLSGDASADNGGSRSTGVPRVNAGLALNGLLGLGDLMQANASLSEGSKYARLAASLPLGNDGWRAGLNASVMRYRLVGSSFAALQAKGSSDTFGADASYPLLRSRTSNLNLSLAADHKRFDNEANGATSSRYQASSGSVGLNGNWQDDWTGGGFTSAGLALTHGRIDLAGSPGFEADQATVRTHGAFSKLRYSASRQQAITANISGFIALAGQASRDNLDSSEKFYLGGPQGVRAYPGSEGGGGSGQMVNIELRAALPAAQMQLTAFVDWGHVRVNARNDFPGANPLNGITLKGAGLALAWRGPQQLTLQATLARRIGSNQLANPLTGADSDGTLRKNRLWLQASLPF